MQHYRLRTKPQRIIQHIHLECGIYYPSSVLHRNSAGIRRRTGCRGTLSELEPVAQPSSQLPEPHAQEAPRIRSQVIMDKAPCEGARHNPLRLFQFRFPSFLEVYFANSQVQSLIKL